MRDRGWCRWVGVCGWCGWEGVGRWRRMSNTPVLASVTDAHDKDAVEHVARRVETQHCARCSGTDYVQLLILAFEVDDSHSVLAVVLLPT